MSGVTVSISLTKAQQGELYMQHERRHRHSVESADAARSAEGAVMTTEYSIDNGATWHVAVPGQAVNMGTDQLFIVRAVPGSPVAPHDAHHARLTLIRASGDEYLIEAVKLGKLSIHAALAKVVGAAHPGQRSLDRAVRALEGYAESYDMMSRMGDGKVDCNSVKHDISRNMIAAVKRAFAADQQSVTQSDATARHLHDTFRPLADLSGPSVRGETK